MSLPADRSTSSRLMQSADCLVSILYRQVQDWWCWQVHAVNYKAACWRHLQVLWYIIKMGRYCFPACTEGTGLLEATCRCCCSVRQLNSLEITQYMQVYITKKWVRDRVNDRFRLPLNMSSHTLSSEELSPFLSGECCYARIISWLKTVPTYLASAAIL